MTSVEALERKLDIAKKDFDKRKEYFLFSVQHEINQSNFERNAIAELAVMLECKARIKTIEETITMLKAERRKNETI